MATDLKTKQDIAALRKLIATRGVCGAARATGRSKGNVSNIKNGRRHKETGKVVNVAELGIYRPPGGKVCPRCNDLRYLFAATGICVECELSDLGRQGVIQITTKPFDHEA